MPDEGTPDNDRPDGSPEPFATREETATEFAAHVNRGKALALEALGVDIVIGDRAGARFQDAFSGRWYWNCHCNGGVFNLGHRNPAVVAVVRDGLDRLDVGNHHLISGHRARLAGQLAASTDGLLPFAVFTPSGTESVDLALRLARAHTGRTGIVAAAGAYHGLSGFALAASDPRWFDPFGPVPEGFAHVPYNDPDAMAAAIGPDTAAVILESIPATLGFPAPAPGYLDAVAAAARAAGALLILDEVQTGLGRTGTRWYYEQEAVEPDMLITGKGLGGGVYPISAVLLRPEIEEFFDANPFAYVSTFGGAEIGCVAASAVMEQVAEPGFLDRVEELGRRFERGFEGMPFALRRYGLTMGLAFDDENGGVFAAKRLIDAGVFAVYAEHDHRVTQFKPPLIVSEAEVDQIVATVRAALG
ncbi:MAG: aminotransferase class III-fold pyridoxal phosphate-dependent enzyme [Solirubrobacterales bacterium]